MIYEEFYWNKGANYHTTVSANYWCGMRVLRPSSLPMIIVYGGVWVRGYGGNSLVEKAFPQIVCVGCHGSVSLA